ncbi:MAG TPA: FG-GAP-like repeat-containing protein [Candidatus Polarisedimenticolia bacterium]|nr:FG-GAP-like repeat-containing protein [Candidatus Polarisedimenticolia bacterium]
MRTVITILLTGALLPAALGCAAAEAQSPSSLVEAREHLRRGLELGRQGLHDGAAAELRRYLETVPDDAEARFHLGRSLLEVARRGRQPLAGGIRELERALELAPDKDHIRFQLAEALGYRWPGTFDPDRAVTLFEEVLRRNPDRYEIRLRYAQWIIEAEIRLARKGDPDRVLQDSAWGMDVARAHLEKVLDIAPRDSDAAIQARTLLGEVQFRSGEWDAARATLEYLMQAYPGRRLNMAPAWNTIGHCRYRKKEYRQAAEAFVKAHELAPSSRYLWDIKLAQDALGGAASGPASRVFPLRKEEVAPSIAAALKFTDIAPRLHINKYAGAGPAGWADYNGDGRFDLIACGCDTFCTLYKAVEGGFEDATIEAGLTRMEPGFGTTWGDYDNDGDPDLFVARNGWNGPARDSLLRNNGDGTFTDVIDQAGSNDPGSTDHGIWVDYDRDGWLDLLVSSGVYLDGSSCQMFRNKGDGTFANVTRQAGLQEEGRFGTIGIAVADFDDDGWPDLFYHGRSAPNRLYRNNRDGTFTETARRAGVEGPGTQFGWTAIAADLDSDGDMDILTGSLAPWDQVLAGYQPDHRAGPLDHIPRFYRNNGNGTFADDSLASGLRYPLGVMAVNAADLDNDGYQEIYFGTGDPELRRLEPNILYHNREGRSFTDVTRHAGVGHLGKGHGITFLDWDGDGDLEIFAEMGGFYHGDLWESAFYLNEGKTANHWLQVRLTQPRLNRDAVGARVTVTAGPVRQAQEVSAGKGFGSTDPPVLHFGLGKSSRAGRVEVRWPDGTRQTLENVEGDRLLSIRRE